MSKKFSFLHENESKSENENKRDKAKLLKDLVLMINDVDSNGNKEYEANSNNKHSTTILLAAVLPLVIVFSLIKIRNHLIEFEELKSEKNRAYGLYDDLVLLSDKTMLNSARVIDMADDLLSSSKQTKIDEVSYVVYEDSSKKNKADKTAMWLEFASNIFSGVASAATSVIGGGGLGGSGGLSGLTGLLSSSTAATSTSAAVTKKN